MTGRDPEGGVVLVNVLVVMAIAASLVVVILGAQDRALLRASLASNMAQAEALARGGVRSVAVALRRDMETGRNTDHFGEPWARVLQESVELETGRFSVAARDANARFDLGRLADGTAVDRQIFARLAALLEIPEETTRLVVSAFAASVPPRSLADLTRIGVDPEDIAALAPHADILPVRGQVNLNTAGPALLAALVGTEASAARLLALRADRGGVLDDAALQSIGLLRPPGTGYTSDLWDVRVVAEVDDATAELAARLQRVSDLTRREVRTVSQRFGLEAASLAPPPEGLSDP